MAADDKSLRASNPLANPGPKPGLLEGGDTSAPNAQNIEVPAPAGKAKFKKRHGITWISFVVAVLVPMLISAAYLWGIARDQYSSVTGFTVRQEENAGATALLGGIAQLAGSSVSVDGDILYEYILSQEIVSAVEASANVIEHYSESWMSDPVFSISPDATIEDLYWFWRRIVRVAYDQSTGLTEVRVLAFDPDKAVEISTAILEASQLKINALNEQARADAMRYATQDLEEAIIRLKLAREALTEFRTRTQILDPSADIQGRMGVLNNLQQQLAEAFISYDLLLQTAPADDPRVIQAQNKIGVIRSRIEDERSSISTGVGEGSLPDDDYPKLLAEFEGLIVDREFAEENYRAALAAHEVARAKIQRRSRYLATYISPTVPQTAEYPQRFVIFSILSIFLLLAWAVIVLIYYSIRDRR